MKRVLCIAFICAGLFALAHRPALAVVEYCPASLAYQPVGKDRTAALFGIELNALGPRSVTAGTLAFDTSGGWYTAKIPSMVITKKERHYTSPSATFTRSDWISPIVYVRFPSAITISHAWVDEIQVAGDGAFGWQERGNVQCDPLPALAPDQKFPTVKNDIQMDPKDQDPLSAPPASDALVVAAQPAKPLESTDCKEPFRLPTVAEQARPSFPDEMLTLGAQGVTSVEIGINADGSLDDAWVWAPSGYGPFDREALSAARRSTYKNGRAYCRDVPGRYLFKVTFLPH
jgi:TonB family protein